MKFCRKCLNSLPDISFGKNAAAKDGLHYECKDCRNASRRLRASTPQGKREAREGQLRANYGIDLETYFAMLESQRGACKICELPPGADSKYVLHVDHCHETNKVRGLLCAACNTGLGKFKDVPALLQRAASYLVSGL